MKVVILAGGKGTRLADETKGEIPKPMVTIGGLPILWHLILSFHHQGFSEFIIAAGYRWEVIKEWFDKNLVLEGMNITVVNTGEETCTGGRVARLDHMLRNPADGLDGGVIRYAPFLLTYGDGLADVNLNMLLDHHVRMHNESDGKNVVTLTAVNPPSRFGRLKAQDGMCEIFLEKGQDPDGWINGGYYVVDPMVLDMIPGDGCVWEKDVLQALALQGRLAAYQHPGEFQMMDTWRDRKHLDKLAQSDDPFWLRWEK